MSLAAALTLTLTGVAGCDSPGTKTSCSVQGSCTVTFDRGVDAKASVLGVEVKLVKVDGDNVTLSVAGQEVTVPVNGSTQTGGFTVSVESVTDTQVVVKIDATAGN